jgi:hypothetical protein
VERPTIFESAAACEGDFVLLISLLSFVYLHDRCSPCEIALTSQKLSPVFVLDITRPYTMFTAGVAHIKVEQSM